MSGSPNSENPIKAAEALEFSFFKQATALPKLARTSAGKDKGEPTIKKEAIKASHAVKRVLGAKRD